MTAEARTRLFANQTLSSTFNRWWTIDVIEPNTFDVFAWISGRYYDRMDDVVISQFYKRSKKGEIFINPLQRETVRWSYLPTTQYYRAQQLPNPMYGGEWTFELPTYWTTPPTIKGSDATAFAQYFSPYSGLLDSAISRAWANVDRAEFQALASLGELPETVKWIISIFRRFINLLKSVRPKKLTASTVRYLKKFGKTSKGDDDMILNLWLELRYAVRPLVFEIDQALKALSAAIEKTLRYTGRGFEVRESTSESVEETYNVNVSHVYDCKKTKSYSVRAGVLYRILNDIDSLIKHWGLDQPVEAFWELTPFSFIIDWFFSVGDTISSWSVDASLGVLGSWTTERLVEIETCTHHTYNLHSAYSTYQIMDIEPGYAKREIFATRRIPFAARTLIPSFRVNLDLAKIADLVAIGRNLLKH